LSVRPYLIVGTHRTCTNRITSNPVPNSSPMVGARRQFDTCLVAFANPLISACHSLALFDTPAVEMRGACHLATPPHPCTPERPPSSVLIELVKDIWLWAPFYAKGSKVSSGGQTGVLTGASRYLIASGCTNTQNAAKTYRADLLGPGRYHRRSTPLSAIGPTARRPGFGEGEVI
jgi:hypothetical protein